jgi:PhnB protein
MKAAIPYLFFNGNCRDAMNFYKQCFGGTVELISYGDAPPNQNCDNAPKDQIMHASLSSHAFSLMASDNPKSIPAQGDNIDLFVECDSRAELQQLFQALSAGGAIRMPLADTFWGSHFGMLTDKYGIHWMLSCPLK